MKLIKLIIAFAFLLTYQVKAQEQKSNNMSSFKEKGVQAPSDNFTGTVWVNMNLAEEDGYNTIMGTVTFEPKARTNWHSHDNGQILMVTKGIGYYQEEGKPIQKIQEGDIVKIGKKVNHWHGASHYQSMSHIAMIPEIDKGERTIWGNKVTDEEYNTYQVKVAEVENYLTPKAIMNHEKFWPNYESTARETDPELIEIFDNWAFDEVYSHSNLDDKTRTLTILASNIGSQALSEYKMFVNAALNVGVTPIEIKEVLYQSVAYVGVAKAVDFIYATNEIFKQRNISLPLEGQSTTNSENRKEKGLELMKATFGERIEEMRKNAPDDLKHIQEYLAGNCFGDYYTRTGLDMPMRELITYSILISMGGTDSQVRGHIQGNLNVGNDRQKLIDVTTQLLPYIGYPRTLNALNAINEITK